MDFSSFIVDNMLILIPVLYILGMMLKNTSQIPDWTIPWILLVLGIIGAITLDGISTETIMQGILVAGTTVFTNQLIKQTKNKD